MKKSLLTILSILAVLALAIAAYFISVSNNVGEFSINNGEYRQIMQDYASDRRVDPVSSAKEAMQAAENIWTELYGLDTILKERPYHVYYDPQSEIWLVSGSLFPFSLGGAAQILIHQDGRVLAVWHEK